VSLDGYKAIFPIRLEPSNVFIGRFVEDFRLMGEYEQRNKRTVLPNSQLGGTFFIMRGVEMLNLAISY
jgi:hypothetical protein